MKLTGNLTCSLLENHKVLQGIFCADCLPPSLSEHFGHMWSKLQQFLVYFVDF